MPEIGWRLPPRALPKKIGILSSLRYGLFKPGNSRLVIDLEGPAKVERAWVLPSSNSAAFRVIIDLSLVSTKKFNQLLSLPAIPIEIANKSKSTVSFRINSRKFETNDSGETDQTFKTLDENEEDTVAKKLKMQNTKSNKKIVSRLAPRKPSKNKINKRLHVIVIDPGHGGADPGAIGRSGTYEKHITLGVAKEFAKTLKKTGRYKVILTRKRDKYIPLRKRVAIARTSEADLFISVHADSVKNRRIRGASVYTLSENASDKEAAELARKENKSDLIFGKDLSNEDFQVANILIDLAQRETMNHSARFANILVNELRHATRVLPRTHRFAGFRVLKAPDVPSVLLELGFLSNRQDEVSLRTKKYRNKIAKAIVKSVDNYFKRIKSASR